MKPESIGVRNSAPAAISSSTTAACPSATAHVRAVCSGRVSKSKMVGSAMRARNAFAPAHSWRPKPWTLLSTEAPCESSARTGPSRPVRAAVISAVSPPGSTVSGSAPAPSRSSTIAPLPLVHASDMAVTPYRLAACGSAPASISSRAVSRSSRNAAQCSAVMPSTCATFGSAPLSTSACARAVSASSAASARSASPAAACAAQTRTAPARRSVRRDREGPRPVRAADGVASMLRIASRIRSTAVPRPFPCCRRTNPSSRPPSPAA